MRFSTSLALIAAAIWTASASQHSVTLWSWRLEQPAPEKMAVISYETDNLSARVVQYTAPTTLLPDDLVRVGLYDTNSEQWNGIVVSAETFNSNYLQRASLHLDDNGNVYHIGFSASPRTSAEESELGRNVQGVQQGSADSKGVQVVVELLKSTPGATPRLNRPVVLDPEGKLPQKEPEKTFLQKYWWAIVAFLIMQVVLTGGGGK